MLGIRVGTLIRALLLTLLATAALEFATTEAEARAGRGRSSGRSSGYGPARQQSQPHAAPNQLGNQNPAMNNSGGFMRGMAGGIAGGFLGSMLFSSLGHAAGPGGGTGGGIGLLEVLLFAGLAYLGFRWWKNRQQAAAAFSGVTQRYGATDLAHRASAPSGSLGMRHFQALAPASIEADEASDIFFKVQGAWTRRDLSSVRDLVGQELQDTFDGDIAELRQSQRINRLENISIRRTETTNSWQEDGVDHSTVRFTANLLDYTVDERTSQVVDGSDSEPVKFEEDWTFARSPGGWQLVGIRQV